MLSCHILVADARRGQEDFRLKNIQRKTKVSKKEAACFVPSYWIHIT